MISDTPRRLRESVASSAEPQLLRGQDDDDDLDLERDGDSDNRLPKVRPKVKKTKMRKAKKASREARPLHVVREAEFELKGSRYLVVLLKEGPGSSGWYSRQALERAVASGVFENLPCHADHPSRSDERDRPERSVRTLVGSFSNARLVESGGRAAVQAVFTPITGDGYHWVQSLVESALSSPGLCGLSIDGNGVTEGVKEHNGRKLAVVQEMKINSVDLVTRPGVRGAGFVRRLSEAATDARDAAGKPLLLGPKGLQGRVREALSAFVDENPEEAFRLLVEAASATVKPPKPRERSSAQPEAEQLADRQEVELRETQERATRAERAALEWGEALREAEAKIARQRDKRKTAEKEAKRLREYAERNGLNRVEGAGPRLPGTLAQNGHGGGELLSRMGIDITDLYRS